MTSIEQSLTNYVQGKNATVNQAEVEKQAEKDVNEMINVLFYVIKGELEKKAGIIPITRIVILLREIKMLLNQYPDINREVISQELQGIEDKLIQIFGEKIKSTIQEIDDLKESIGGNQELSNENTQFGLVSFLVNIIRDETYVEFAFDKMPSLINAKDRNNVSTFQSILHQYVDSVKEKKEEDIQYFGNLLSLVLSHKGNHLSDSMKKSILHSLYVAVDKISYTKKVAKQNRDQIDWLNSLIESIKNSGDKRVNVEGMGKKYNIELFFPESIYDYLNLERTPRTGEIRRPIGERIITMDKEGTSVIDDGLSCRRLPNGNYLLGVHTGSLLGHFDYNSPIIEEAFNRTRSIHLSKKFKMDEETMTKTIPLLPPEFIVGEASLSPGKTRPARSYFFEISPAGEIVKEEFLKSSVQSSMAMSFQEADRLLENGVEDETLQDLFTNLQEVCGILSGIYHPDELYLRIKDNVEDASNLRVKRTGAERLVFYPMLLVGNRVAEFFADPSHGYPFPYRILEEDSENIQVLRAMVENLTKTYGEEQGEKLYQLINGLYPKAKYALSGKHDGLRIAHYGHCTSEFRRAMDILSDHCQEVCYDKNPTDQELRELEREVEKRVGQVNNKQNSIDWFVKEYSRAYQKKR